MANAEHEAKDNASIVVHTVIFTIAIPNTPKTSEAVKSLPRQPDLCLFIFIKRAFRAERKIGMYTWVFFSILFKFVVAISAGVKVAPLCEYHNAMDE
ncbi:hypothetical protein DXV75_13745 [Alteromonas aestuariivivens]|uniref:Uncharacterized protein n=1 Tax=Alteromonas aestuariivivens TaxID=1938339 RepID=A0A3D8M5Q1_9ALTE|nr:hypothetical protein [Alteromonas aestuariivivens]RDV24482.1 hypothetical protein DXV75_13745 [Alteromonas aestuariivivens]